MDNMVLTNLWTNILRYGSADYFESSYGNEKSMCQQAMYQDKSSNYKLCVIPYNLILISQAASNRFLIGEVTTYWLLVTAVFAFAGLCSFHLVVVEQLSVNMYALR